MIQTTKSKKKKKKGKQSLQKRRWFLLKGDTLSYMKHPKSPAVIGAIKLVDIHSILPIEMEVAGRKKCFQIIAYYPEQKAHIRYVHFFSNNLSSHSLVPLAYAPNPPSTPHHYSQYIT